MSREIPKAAPCHQLAATLRTARWTDYPTPIYEMTKSWMQEPIDVVIFKEMNHRRYGHIRIYVSEKHKFYSNITDLEYTDPGDAFSNAICFCCRTSTRFGERKAVSVVKSRSSVKRVRI